MAQKVQIQQHDKGIKVFFNVTIDGVVEPITGSTVYFKYMNKTSGRQIIKPCEITDGELVGNYITELEIEFENGTRLSVDNPIMLAITKENICHHGRSIRMF